MADLGFGDLVIPASEYDGDSLAEPWAWRLGDTSFVLAATAMGHMFLELGNGSVWFLDTWSGDLERVAASDEEFRVALTTQDFIREWLMPECVAALIDAGMHRAGAECFSPFVSPGLGGPLTPTNFQPFSLRLHIATSAAEVRAVQGK